MTSERMPPEPSWRRLYRNPRRGWIAGVCAGIADYFGLSAGLVRLLTVVLMIAFTLPTLLAYVIAALVLERRPGPWRRAARRRRSGARSGSSRAARRVI
jgi:phage shock protein C